MRLPKPETRTTTRRGLIAAGLPTPSAGLLRLVACLAALQGAAWAAELAWESTPAGNPNLNTAQECAPTTAARACWASMPVLQAPNGMRVHFEDDVPSQGWQMAINLDTPTPLDLLVFSRLSGIDELADREVTIDRQRKPEDGDDGGAETSADSWGYELLVLLGLGVLAILASAARLRKRRRGKRGDAGSRNKVRTRKRVRLDTRL